MLFAILLLESLLTSYSIPTSKPTINPSRRPTYVPTIRPSQSPSRHPSINPTVIPTSKPTSNPSRRPTYVPTIHPSQLPSRHPSINPTVLPTSKPTSNPSRRPTYVPTIHPSQLPSRHPSINPTVLPTIRPTSNPSRNPTYVPTIHPSQLPSRHPSINPTVLPTKAPTPIPTKSPSMHPSYVPTVAPSKEPTVIPTWTPSANPTHWPTVLPSEIPTHEPTSIPTELPSTHPSSEPSEVPTHVQTALPSAEPSDFPSSEPSSVTSTTSPTAEPTATIISAPTVAPSVEPTEHPLVSPTVTPSSYPALTGEDFCNIFGVNSIEHIINSTSSFQCESKPFCRFPSLSPLVTCSGSDVVGIDFSGEGLSGNLPVFAEVTAIAQLNLSHNSYTGSISSAFVQNLPHLRSLDLSGNSLMGTVPSSLCSLSALTEVKLSGNSFGCYDSCVSSTAVVNDFVGSLSSCSSGGGGGNGGEGGGGGNIGGGGEMSNRTREASNCLDVEVIDLYGDGWGPSSLIVFSEERGELANLAPSCEESPKRSSVCLVQDGDTVVIEIVGFRPDQPWEILWRVTNRAAGTVYTGNYDTSLTFNYRNSRSMLSPSLELTDYAGIVYEADNTCDECLQKYVYGNSAGSMIFHHSSRRTDRAHNRVGDGESVMDLVYDLSAYSTSIETAPKFYMTTPANELLVSGALCGTAETSCPITLDDGDYSIRVTNSQDSELDLEWSFCGVSGYGDEVSFSMKGGECLGSSVHINTMSMSCVTEIQDNSLSEVLTKKQNQHKRRRGKAGHLLAFNVLARGVIELSGTGVDPLTAEESEVLRSAIVNEFSDARIGDVNMNGSSNAVVVITPERQLNVQSRRMKSVTAENGVRQVTFQATMDIIEEDMVELKTYLDKSMTSGLFVSRVRSLAKTAYVPNMRKLSHASIVDLRVIHETVENEEMSMFGSAVVGVCGGVGLLFAGLMLVSYLRNRQSGYTLLERSETASSNTFSLSSRDSLSATSARVAV